jgi:hypothetical protein
MRDFFYKLVQRLHDSGRPLSRNKHFLTFADGGARRALHIDRHLRDLEAALERARERDERPRLRAMPDGGVQIVLSDPRLLVVRTALLTREEVALLKNHPAGAWALEGLHASEPAQPSAVPRVAK